MKSKTDEERKDRNEEKLSRSIIKGFARYNRERHARLAPAEEEDQRAQCLDDITEKELSWSEVRQARDQELAYVRDLGVHEKVDEREAIETYQVTPVDTKWIDTNRAFEDPCKSGHELWQDNSKLEIVHILYAGSSSVGSAEGKNLCCSESQANIVNHAHRRVKSVFSRKGSKTCAGTPASGRHNGRRRRKTWIVEKKSWYGTQDAANWSVIGKNFAKVGKISWSSARRICSDMSGTTLSKQKSSVTGQQKAPKGRGLNWGKRGVVDPRHACVLVKDLGHSHGNSLHTAAVHFVTDEETEPLDQEQSSQYRSQVARCFSLSQDRSDMPFIVNELCQRVSGPALQSLAKFKKRPVGYFET